MNKILAAFGLLAMFACTTKKEVVKPEETTPAPVVIVDFEQISLTLIEIKIDGKSYSPGAEEITLYIDAKGKTYSGKAACNSFYGRLEITDNKILRFMPGASTEMLCEAEAMQWQARIFNALFGRAYTLVRTENQFQLNQVTGDNMLYFNKLNP